MKKKKAPRLQQPKHFTPGRFRTITATGETITGSKVTVAFSVSEKAAYYHDAVFLAAGYFIRNFPELRIGGIEAKIEPSKIDAIKGRQDLQGTDIKLERREK